MSRIALYDMPALYDRLVPPGPCERFYAELADGASSLLELGCGTGRLTVPLSRRAGRTTGLDASPAMLSAARRKAAEAGATIRFVEGDLIDLALGERFDLIVLSCNTLAHMTGDEDLAAALAGVRRHLTDHGLFALDVANARKRPPASDGRETVRRAHSRDGLRVRERATFDPASGVKEARWRVEAEAGQVIELAPIRLRAFPGDSLPDALRAAGFALAERYGDFDRRPWRASSSRMQVCVAHKA